MGYKLDIAILVSYSSQLSSLKRGRGAANLFDSKLANSLFLAEEVGNRRK